MGIFKESLNKYVENQLKARQEIIGTEQNRANTPGFHAYTTNKYCNIRMASGVDITDDQLLELDFKIGNVVIEKDLRGYGLAKNYILQGGTLLNPKGAKKPALRRGFPGKGRPLGGAYGDPLMRGDARDDYGIVPMPGITDFNVRTKSAYGSLREGKVNFVCHNLRQLAVLEILYMRPGYPVLVEWCWDPYIDNDGKLVKGADIDKHFISNNNDFFTGKINQKYTCAEIARQRKNSFGNYDALLGLCKNFSYSARPDGGFNCTTELMAVGESINTIKGRDISINTEEAITTDFDNAGGGTTTVHNKIIKIPYVLDFLEKTHDFVHQNPGDSQKAINRQTRTEGPDDQLGTEDDEVIVGKNFNRSSAYHNTPQRRGNWWITFYKDRINITNLSYSKVRELYKAQYFDDLEQNERGEYVEGTKSINEELTESAYKNWHTMHFVKGREEFWAESVAYVLLANPSTSTTTLAIMAIMWLTSSGANKTSISEGYLRLDALCYIINKYSMADVAKDPSERTTCFQTLNYQPAKAGTKSAVRMNSFKVYDSDLGKILQNMGDTSFKGGIVDCSTDPYVCLMPHQTPDKFTKYGYSKNYCRPIKNIFGFPDGPDGQSFVKQFNKSFPWGSNKVLTESQSSIGHIMINIRFLLKCHDELFEKGKENNDYSVGKFMQKVLDGINNVMGNGLKLSMTTDNQFPNITQIVDLNHGPKTPYKDIFTFNVLSDNTVVRDFSFNSAVPSSMSSTIAVGAGDPDNVSDLDGVTFAAMNRGIRNRLYQPSSAGKTKNLSAEEKQELKNKYEAEILEILTLGNQIANYQMQIQAGQILNNTEANKREISVAKTNLTRLQTLVNQVSLKDENGLPKRTTDANGKVRLVNPPASTPIPIKIDMVLDGIGGIVIGQLFRVEESRLPLQYRNKNIIFVCVAEEQKVDANGKWTTKISGQMQLFPDDVTPNAPTDFILELASFDPAPYCKILADALHSVNDDEEAIEKVFFASGLSNLELKRIEQYFNENDEYRRGGGVTILGVRIIPRDMDLHKWIEDDYRYGGKSTLYPQYTGNQLARQMYDKLGHTPTW